MATTKKPRTIKNPISYTVSNTFKAPMAKVWEAALKGEHLKGHFVDDTRGEFNARLEPVGWYWKVWGWMEIKPLKYVRNKELIFESHWTEKYLVTVRFECVRKGNQTILRVHETGYPSKDLKMAFMMAEGWAEFLCGIKAYMLGVDLRRL